jgi:hypothetical protein
LGFLFFVALQEATKGGYENWKVWANMVVAAIDTGAFHDAIIAIKRILELNKPFDDAQIISILGDSIVAGISDQAGQSGSQRNKNKF